VRKQRRETDRSAQKELLRKDNKKGENLYGSFLRNMLKSKILRYTFATALALGSFEVAREQIPLIRGTKPKYDLTLVLLEHDGESNAKRLFDEVDFEAENGRPYKIFFSEASTQLSSTYVEDVIGDDKYSSKIRNDYRSLLDSGYSKSQAEMRILQISKPYLISTADRELVESEKEFYARLIVCAAVRGIKILPLESRSQAEVERDVAALSRYEEVNDRLHKNGPNLSLKELIPFYLEEQKDRLDYTTNRNYEINQNIERRFDQALEIFPELRIERLKGNQLRAIGFIGYAHGRFLSPHRNINIKEEEYEITDPIGAKILRNTLPTQRPYTKRESYIVALDDRYISPVLNHIDLFQQWLPPEKIQGLPKRLVDGTLNLTEAQLEDIDKGSLKISTSGERWAYILNQIIGEDIFKAKMFG
jgi:hypothetical protein